MAEDQRSESTGAPRFVVLAVGFVILLLLLLPPVRGMLNQVPYLWEVLYPVLTVLAGYLVVSAVQAAEPFLSVLTGVLLLVAAASMTGYTYGAAPLFFTVGRWSALLFIVAEVVHLVIDMLRAPAKAGGL
jgi:hypothetical protein